MAIAYDASSNGAWSSGTSYSWTHTPSGTPAGVVVSYGQEGTTQDIVTGITYGGVAMARINRATANDNSDLYFLGSSIPTGAQTVVVNLSTGSPNGSMSSAAVTVTAGAGKNTQLAGTGSGVVNGGNNPSVTITGISGASYGFGTSIGSVIQTAGSGQTSRKTLTVSTKKFDTESSTSQTASGNLTIAYTVTGGNDAFVAMAIEEVAAPVAKGNFLMFM